MIRLAELFRGPAPLTRERIAALPPRKLYREVFRHLPDADAANPSQWDFVLAAELDGEVRNGGFNQYYYNASDHRERAVGVLEQMGAADAARIVRRANECFEANREQLEILWDGTKRGVVKSYALKLFNELDARYYAAMSEERFLDLLAAFVRSRAGDFVGAK